MTLEFRGYPMRYCSDSTFLPGVRFSIAITCTCIREPHYSMLAEAGYSRILVFLSRALPTRPLLPGHLDGDLTNPFTLTFHVLFLSGSELEMED